MTLAAPTFSPAHLATLQALAGLCSLDAVARLHAMPRALSGALCASCGVDREGVTWASLVHAFALRKAGGHSITRPEVATSGG